MNSNVKFIILVCITLSLFTSASANFKEGAATKINSVSQGFIENVGQVVDQNGNPRVDIDVALVTDNLSIFIGKGKVLYQWHKMISRSAGEPLLEYSTKSDDSTLFYRLDATLIGANQKCWIEFKEEQVYKERYYIASVGGSKGAVANTYKKIVYHNIYDNIDWVIYVNGKELKYDFIVRKGGDANDIKISYAGANKIIEENGFITISTPMGSIEEGGLYIYDIDTKEQIPSSFLVKDSIVQFNIQGRHDEVVIDPVLNWATFYGANNAAYAYNITTDKNENAILAGFTYTTSLIATSGTHQQTNSSNKWEGLIAKFNKSGNLVWSTFFGGVNDDFINGVDVDEDDNIYIAASVQSTGLSTPNAYKGYLSGIEDALIAKFDVDGKLVWSTYVGGDTVEGASNLVYSHGSLYIAGRTYSTNGIATPGAYQTVGFNPPNASSHSLDAYIMKFDTSGGKIWGTYFAGAYEDSLSTIATSQDGQYIYVGGRSSSGLLAKNGYQNTKTYNLGVKEPIFAKFTSGGSLVWASYYSNNTGSTILNDIACDRAGNVYICGSSNVTGGVGTTGSYHPDNVHGDELGFITKFDSSCKLQYGSYLSTSTGFQGNMSPCMSIEVLPSGHVIATGYITGPTLPATGGAIRTTLYRWIDAYFLIMNPSGTDAFYRSYYGGSSDDVGIALDVSKTGILYLSILSESLNGFATPGAYQTFKTGVGTQFGLVSIQLDSMAYFDGPITRQYCQGDTFDVDYGLHGTFSSGNTFSVELSDDTGAFTSPIVIGTINATTAGKIKCVIPINTPSGTGYKLRITSTTPQSTSYNCAEDITISLVSSPIASISSDKVFPVGPFSSVKFTATVANGGNLLTYQWQKNGSDIPGENKANCTLVTGVDINSNDTIACRVDNGSLCALSIDTSNEIVAQVNMEIPKNTSSAQVQLYPNPTGGVFTLSGKLEKFSTVRLVVVDMLGRTVFTKVLKIEDGYLNAEVTLPKGLPNGLYQLNLSKANHTFPLLLER